MAAISYIINLGQPLEQVSAGNNAPGAFVAAIVTAGSAPIAATNNFTAGYPIVFSGSFGTVTGLVASTTYYVSATGLSGSQFEVSATPGGSVITPGGTGSASVTVNNTGAVELRIDQTAIVTDASIAGGLRPINSADVVAMVDTLMQYFIRDPNKFQQ